VWLVDTSAWVEFLRAPRRLLLEDLAPCGGQIVTCLSVIQELLQGIDDERAYSGIHAALLAWPVHCDRDFAAISRVTGLRHVDLSPRLTRRN